MAISDIATSKNLSAIIEGGDGFDVDPQSGFMPPAAPSTRLPSAWEPWEAILEDAIASDLQLGDRPGLSDKEKATSEAWRARVRQLPILPTLELESSKIMLRRAHHILTYIMHFYIQSLPPLAPVNIPPPLALPIVRVSTQLDIPPLLTYSDTVLYNWTYRHPTEDKVPAMDNLRTGTLFSGLSDEEEFYLCSAKIELRGVEALEIMRVTMDEIFIGDQTAVRRIAGYLKTLVTVIGELKTLLLDVQKDCRPEEYYNLVRPWFRGQDSDINKRIWNFEGLEQDPSLKKPTELSGPSAAQSSIIHVLDVFLSVDHQSSPGNPSFMSRMQTYMPRSHRLFLDHLSANPRPLRSFVKSSEDAELHDAYNLVVMALKEFRDAHMIIAALYILGPARRAKQALEVVPPPTKKPVLGTGGTDLVKFLKDTRNRTKDTVIP